MSEVILVRHGESKMNEKSLFCGWTDSPLTLKGKKQAMEVRDKLKNEKIDLIISSDLNRCHNTAEIINLDHQCDIITTSGLKEFNFGKWEGLSYDDIRSTFPVEADSWQKDYVNYKVPGGESLMEMYDRVVITYDKIIRENLDKNLLIVSHAGVIRSILSKEICGGIECYWKFKINNCGITKLEYVDGFTVLKGVNQ